LAEKIRHISLPERVIPLVMLLSVMLASPKVLSQQNTQFTQYISNELLVNPAYAGAEEALSISLLSKAQWAGVDGAPNTQSLTAHSLIKSNKVGLGFTIVNDKIGIHSRINASSSFAYRLELKQNTFLSFGLLAGISQEKSDFGSLSGQVQNPNDPKLNSTSLSQTNLEVGSGVYLITPRLNMGISMPNMLYKNEPSDSISSSLLNNNIFFIFRYSIPITNNFVLKPGLLMRYTNGLPLYMDINIATVVNNVLLVGISYRYKESINPIIQAKITPQFKIGYAFDYPIANESSFGSNSHEFMVSYLFSFSKHKVAELR